MSMSAVAQVGPLSEQPGFTLPDYIVQEHLRAQLAFIRANPAVIRQPLGGYGQAFVGQMMAVLQRKSLPVYEGWPVQAEMVPGIGVTLRPKAEATFGIGAQIATLGTGGELYAVGMQATVQITCYGTSQREANALAEIVSWLLQVLRIHLEGVEGLRGQSVSVQDIRPEEEAPLKLQFLFMRAVVFSCEYEDTWALEYPVIGDFFGGASDDPT